MKQTNVLFMNYCFLKGGAILKNKEQFILNEIKNPLLLNKS